MSSVEKMEHFLQIRPSDFRSVYIQFNAYRTDRHPPFQKKISVKVKIDRLGYAYKIKN